MILALVLHLPSALLLTHTVGQVEDWVSAFDGVPAFVCDVRFLGNVDMSDFGSEILQSVQEAALPWKPLDGDLMILGLVLGNQSTQLEQIPLDAHHALYKLYTKEGGCCYLAEPNLMTIALQVELREALPRGISPCTLPVSCDPLLQLVQPLSMWILRPWPRQTLP